MSQFLKHLKHTVENHQLSIKYEPYVDRETTTVLPVPMGAATCQHDWMIKAQQKLDSSYQQKFVCILECPKCGALDKTIEVTDKQPPQVVPKSECRHKWGKEQDAVITSAYEQIVDGLITAQKTNRNYSENRRVKVPELPDTNNLPSWMFRKTYIKERVCQECGEISTIIATNISEPES